MLSCGRLQQQSDTGISEENYRQFRSRLEAAFRKVIRYWQEPNGDKQLLHFGLDEIRLVLYRSPLLIGKARQSAAEAECGRGRARQILASCRFDMETRRKAR